MKTAAVLYRPRFSKSAPEVPEYLDALPGLARRVFLGDLDLPGNWETFGLPETAEDLIKALQAASEGCDVLIYVNSDCPFLRRDLTEILFETHRKYRAHYTFADGLPYGLAPEILDPSVLPSLGKLAAKYKDITPGRSVIFDVAAKDINAFDLETWISPRDLRPLRLSFTLDSRRNSLLVERYRERSSLPLEDFLTLLESEQSPQRTLPAYFHIQTVTAAENLPSFDARRVLKDQFPHSPKVMELHRFEKLMEKISTWAGDGVVNPGLWGDPAFHPDFPGLVETVCSREGWSMVVETPLTDWKSGVWERAAAVARDQLTWIVELDAWEKEAYRKLRGDGFERALEGVEQLLNLFPGKVHVQITRNLETEEQLEGFYRGWKSRNVPVIIQKYDSLAGRLPDLKVNDISPLRRRACWHLKRDFCVLSDGRLTLCRTDFNGQFSSGNVFEEELEALWDKGQKFYLEHLSGNYGTFCEKCDEFYTYNF